MSSLLMGLVLPRSTVKFCPGACAVPDVHRVATSPSNAFAAVVPPPVTDALAECVPLCSTGSAKRLNSAIDQWLALVPVWVTRT